MPTVRTIKVWHTETVEIEWVRRTPETEHAASPNHESLIERRTCPPSATWTARSETGQPPIPE